MSELKHKEGCRKPLAKGQWWTWCGETDMGQTLPALCTECGGRYKLRPEDKENDIRLECSRTKKCGWQGLESQLKKIPNNKHLPMEVFDCVCPSCGCKSYYKLDSD